MIISCNCYCCKVQVKKWWFYLCATCWLFRLGLNGLLCSVNSALRMNSRYAASQSNVESTRAAVLPVRSATDRVPKFESTECQAPSYFILRSLMWIRAELDGQRGTILSFTKPWLLTTTSLASSEHVPGMWPESDACLTYLILLNYCHLILSDLRNNWI